MSKLTLDTVKGIVLIALWFFVTSAPLNEILFYTETLDSPLKEIYLEFKASHNALFYRTLPLFLGGAIGLYTIYLKINIPLWQFLRCQNNSQNSKIVKLYETYKNSLAQKPQNEIDCILSCDFREYVNYSFQAKYALKKAYDIYLYLLVAILVGLSFVYKYLFFNFETGADFTDFQYLCLFLMLVLAHFLKGLILVPALALFINLISFINSKRKA